MSGVALLLLVALAVGFVAVLRFGRRRRVTEPSCGRCGYNVTGLTTSICPECGSDLNAVGIRRPGDVRSIRQWVKIGTAMLVTLAPAFLVGLLTMLYVAPYPASSVRRRVIFSHIEGLNLTVTVEQSHDAIAMGWRHHDEAGPMDRMRLILNEDRSKPSLDVELATGDAAIEGVANITAIGPFGPAAVGRWLRARGVAHPRMDEVANAVVTAIRELDTPAGEAFASYLPDGSRGGASEVQANPVSPTWTLLTPTAWSDATYWAAGVLVWLAGVCLAVRMTRERAPRAPDLPV